MAWEGENNPPRLRFAKCPPASSDTACSTEEPGELRPYETITVRATDGLGSESAALTFNINLLDPCGPGAGDSLVEVQPWGSQTTTVRLENPADVVEVPPSDANALVYRSNYPRCPFTCTW
jgi:hypothetical protein